MFATDVSNASRTMLMNIHERKWDEGLSNFFSVPISALPKIHSSAEILGYMADGPLKGVPISGVTSLLFFMFQATWTMQLILFS